MTSYLRPKSRLRRLLGLKSRRDSATTGYLLKDDHADESPYETEVSSTSSGTLSHNEFGTGGDEPDDSFFDPYADVRERLERLSARDRSRYASHEDEDEEDDSSSRQCNGMKQQRTKPVDMELPLFAAYTTYLGYAVLIFCGHIRDLFARLFRRGRYLRGATPYKSDDLDFHAPLLKSWENFYTRRLYHRIQDCFNRPIASNPGAKIQVLERVSDDGNKTMSLLGTLDDLDNDRQRKAYAESANFVQVSEGRVARTCLNLGSYNYLGFADDWQVTCRKDVLASLQDLPVSSSSCRNEFGTTKLHKEVEEIVARFLGKEDALALNMGFNTNSTTIPALTSRGDLLISDEMNHTSIVNGARASGAAIRIFRHNDCEHLEEILKEAIVMGRPRTRRPWNKIMVIVEGIYSMEGEYCDLANVVRVCKKYGAYVYLDEAHSIGAMGPTGRGCAEYCGVDTADIDIMMGTFTKSFGGMGGYISGTKDVISFLRRRCAGSAYHNSLSPAVCQQVISSFKVRLSNMTSFGVWGWTHNCTQSKTIAGIFLTSPFFVFLRRLSWAKMVRPLEGKKSKP
jgi:serine palmitoyltransferase